MSEFRLAPEAEAELDDIWLHIARQTGSVNVASRIVEHITEHFWLLARHPYLGRQVIADGKKFEARARIDTPLEAEYYRNGGILPYVLRQLAARVGGRVGVK